MRACSLERMKFYCTPKNLVIGSVGIRGEESAIAFCTVIIRGVLWIFRCTRTLSFSSLLSKNPECNQKDGPLKHNVIRSFC